MEQNSKSLRQLLGFLTDHWKFSKHLTVLGLQINNMCRFCEELEESSEHLINERPAVLIQKRIRCLSAYYVPTEYQPSSEPSQLLTFIMEIGLNEAL